MLVFRTGTHKMLVRVANGEDPDQTALASCTVVYQRILEAYFKGEGNIESKCICNASSY